jgi:antitoxin ChpS
MLAVPPALLELLDLRPGQCVNITADQDKLIVEKKTKPNYTLAELLAASDYGGAPEIDREWLDAPAVGREIL